MTKTISTAATFLVYIIVAVANNTVTCSMAAGCNRLQATSISFVNEHATSTRTAWSIISSNHNEEIFVVKSNKPPTMKSFANVDTKIGGCNPVIGISASHAFDTDLFARSISLPIVRKQTVTIEDYDHKKSPPKIINLRAERELNQIIVVTKAKCCKKIIKTVVENTLKMDQLCDAIDSKICCHCWCAKGTLRHIILDCDLNINSILLSIVMYKTGHNNIQDLFIKAEGLN